MPGYVYYTPPQGRGIYCFFLFFVLRHKILRLYTYRFISSLRIINK